MIKRLLVLFLFMSNCVFSQLDSIQLLVSKENNSNKKVDVLLNGSKTYSNSDNALAFSKQAYSIALNSENKILIAKSSLQLGIDFFNKKLGDSCTYYLDIAEAIYASTSDKDGLFDTYIAKTEILKRENKLEASLHFANKLIEIAEHMDDPDKAGQAYYKMGRLFSSIKDIEKQILYYNKALKLFTKTNNLNRIEMCYIQLGSCYSNKGQYDYAIEYFERGLQINQKTKNCEFKANLLTGIGTVYFYLTNNEKALYFYKDALAVQQKCDPNNVVGFQSNIAVVLMDLERYNEAKPYLIEAYYSAIDARVKADGAFNLAQTYEQLGDYNTAMDFMDIYVRVNDSLNSAMYSSNLSEVEAKYRNEKQEEQNVLLNERLKRKSLQIYYALAGILLLSGLAFFIFRGLRQKNKANLALEEKNKIIEEKSLIVEEQHKDITDSIKYAQRIQQAILPPDKLWNSILPDSFVFYQPKDILSGDFYWIEESPEFIFIAAADCTGHGVPGALMSIVNYNLLNKAVLEQGLTDAGAILDSVNKYLTLSLHQTFQESAVRDGMDVSLCVIDKSTKKLNFAGAYNSVYLLRSNEIQELVPDKQPVGAFMEDNIKPFKNQYFQLMENDVVYMFTDGYADQFGGEKGKKYKYKQLQQLLLDSHRKPFSEQKALVKKSINDWKGNLEQVDDILLLGFKLI